MPIEKLTSDIKACRICAAQFDHEPRPVLQISSAAKVLIAGQAPGTKVHASGIPFDDASGDRLRAWMGIDKSVFYNPEQIAIVPMAFCYPGRGKSGDLPPPPICAATWRSAVMAQLSNIELTLLVGQYAQQWHLAQAVKSGGANGGVNRNTSSLTERVRTNDWGSGLISLPHPSPRNNIWLKKNSWFEAEQLPELAKRVGLALKATE